MLEDSDNLKRLLNLLTLNQFIFILMKQKTSGFFAICYVAPDLKESGNDFEILFYDDIFANRTDIDEFNNLKVNYCPKMSCRILLF